MLSVVLLVLASGLMGGYVEQLLDRGVAVRMLRAGGHREPGVAALPSLLCVRGKAGEPREVKTSA